MKVHDPPTDPSSSKGGLSALKFFDTHHLKVGGGGLKVGGYFCGVRWTIWERFGGNLVGFFLFLVIF